jgi:hypothetical protein
LGIPQGLPVLPLLFLIYFSAFFDKVEASVPAVMSLSFVDDLEFIAEGRSANKIAETLETVAVIVAQRGLLNSVLYDISKRGTLLFTRARLSRRRKAMKDSSIEIRENQVKFNEDATRWCHRAGAVELHGTRRRPLCWLYWITMYMIIAKTCDKERKWQCRVRK